MTRSLFDPTGGNTAHSGSRFTEPDAVSNLPLEITNPAPEVPMGTVDFQPPVEQPAIEVSPENDGKVLVIHMTGKLHRTDYQHFVPIVEAAVQKHGKVRMLVLMHNFHGWDASALLEDVKFDLKSETFPRHRAFGDRRRNELGEVDGGLLRAVYDGGHSVFPVR